MGIQPRIQKTLEKFHLFDSAEECARAAAPIFLANRWRWTRVGIPDEPEILRSLLDLKQSATEYKDRDYDYCESGRLLYYEGQFGFQKPREGSPATLCWSARREGLVPMR